MKSQMKIKGSSSPIFASNSHIKQEREVINTHSYLTRGLTEHPQGTSTKSPIDSPNAGGKHNGSDLSEWNLQTTNLRERMDNALVEFSILREGLDNSGRYPSCGLTIDRHGKINCDMTIPLQEEEFLRECQKCRTRIKKILAHLNLTEDEQ